MNKILIALVLAVVMSGNAYARVNHLFCLSEYGYLAYGYVIESNERYNSLYYYQSSSDEIAKRSFSTEWSSKYIHFTQDSNGKRDGIFNINREDLTINKRKLFYDTSSHNPYVAWGKCELIADEGMLKSKVAKFYSQKQNNNKF